MNINKYKNKTKTKTKRGHKNDCAQHILQNNKYDESTRKENK